MTESENIVSRAFAEHLFDEFVFLSPKTMVGNGRQQNELSDVLLLCRGMLLITQIKMPEQEAHERRGPARRARWFAKNARDALRQIKRTWSYIERGRPEPLRNERRSDVVLDRASIEAVVGLAVVGRETPLETRVERVAYAGITIPVLTVGLREFHHLVRGLDTPADFVEALKVLWDAVGTAESQTESMPTLGACLGVLATFSAPWGKTQNLPLLARDHSRSVKLWREAIRAGGWFDGRRKRLEASYAFDSVMRQLHLCPERKAEVNTWMGISDPEDLASEWVSVLLYLAGLTRIRRQFFGEALLGVGMQALKRAGPCSQYIAVGDNEYPTIVAAVVAPENERARFLSAVAHCHWAVRKPQALLAIICDPSGQHGTSFQFVLLSGDPPDEASLPQEWKPLLNTVKSLRSFMIDSDTGFR